MEAEGLGIRREWLRRRRKVPKSAWSRGDRPTEERHHATIALSAPPALGFDPVGRITVVDDVITSGATLHACVRRIAASFPSADVAAFAVVRTIAGVAQLSKAFDPVREGKGLIVLKADGSTQRTP
jgi:predicted amidophosphoribosyltransferase